jgi:hypothetical protein
LRISKEEVLSQVDLLCQGRSGLLGEDLLCQGRASLLGIRNLDSLSRGIT